MNREETLALYEQGIDAWNKWANEMLQSKKRFLENGEWEERKYKWIENTSVNFSSVSYPHEFKKEMNFINLIFPSKVYFTKATFKGYVQFDNITFYDKVNFSYTEFKSTTSFIDTNFQDPVLFHKSKFIDEVTFRRCKFNANAWYDQCIFYENADYELAHFLKETSFKNAKFLKSAEFRAIHSDSAFSLEGTVFQNHVPNFDQAHFVEAPRLDNIVLGADVSPGNFKNSITTFIHPDIKVRYQALKRLAVQAHDHENEQRFWAGELRSSRSLKKEDSSWSWPERGIANWLGNIIYASISDYGRSIYKPIVAWICLTLLITLIHLWSQTSNSSAQLGIENIKMKIQMSDNVKLDKCNTFNSALHLAFKKSILGLGQDASKRNIYVRDYTCLYGTYNDNETPKIPNSIFWIELLHTLFSAILIFLTLLGIRNNFKLK